VSYIYYFDNLTYYLDY